MKTFYFHPTVTTQYRGETVKRRATVAAIAETINFDDGTATVQFRFGLSVCSEKDQFIKRYGRSSAMGKARSNNPTVATEVAFPETPTAQTLNKHFLGQAIELLAFKDYNVEQKPQKHATTPA